MTSFEESTQELQESIEDFKTHLVHEDDEPEVITRLRRQCDDLLISIDSAEFQEVCW